MTLWIPSGCHGDIRTFTQTINASCLPNCPADLLLPALKAHAELDVLKQAAGFMAKRPVLKKLALTEDEVLALSAGVLRDRIMIRIRKQAPGQTGIAITAGVDVEADAADEKIQTFVEDRRLLERYQRNLDRKAALLSRAVAYAGSGEWPDATLNELYRAFQAVEWERKALDIMAGGEDKTKARAYLDRAIALDPRYPGPFFNRGNLYRATGQIQKAIDDYSRSTASRSR